MTRDTKETNTLAKTVDDEESPPCVVGGGGAVDEEGGEAPGVADTEMASFWPKVQWLPMVQT